MFFKYSPITSRLVPSTQLAAYAPQGLTPYAGESSPIVFSSKTVKAQSSGTAEALVQAGTSSARSMASSASAASSGPVGIVPSAPGYKKVMELQKMFCRDDGKLVWMKRGGRDMIPYYITMGLMVFGMGYGFYTIYEMSVPKKK